MFKKLSAVILSAVIVCLSAIPYASAADTQNKIVSFFSNEAIEINDNLFDTKEFLAESGNGNTIYIHYKSISKGSPNDAVSIYLYRCGKSGKIPVLEYAVFPDSEIYRTYTIPNGDTGTYMVRIIAPTESKGYLTVEQMDGDRIEMPFTDVASTSWYWKPVQYGYEYQLLSGTSKTTFSPDMQVTRGQMLTLLGNMHCRLTGDIIQSEVIDFTDIPERAYYTQYLHWAYKNNLIAGYGDGRFHPDDVITREQMAVILDKYIQISGIAFTASKEYTPSADKDQISGWAKDAVRNMLQYGIMEGKNQNTFDPKGSVTRAESAAVIIQLHQNLI